MLRWSRHVQVHNPNMDVVFLLFAPMMVLTKDKTVAHTCKILFLQIHETVASIPGLCFVSHLYLNQRVPTVTPTNAALCNFILLVCLGFFFVLLSG